MSERLRIKGFRRFDVNDGIQSIFTNHLIFSKNIKLKETAQILNAKYSTVRQRKLRFLVQCKRRRVNPTEEIQRQVNIIKGFFNEF